MKTVFNRENEQWIRPWMTDKFDDLYNRDERFFSIVIRGYYHGLIETLYYTISQSIILYSTQVHHICMMSLMDMNLTYLKQLEKI